MIQSNLHIRDIWVGTSWKMNKTFSEAMYWSEGIKEFLSTNELPIQPFVAPPFTLLHKVARQLIDCPILVGAQNMHWEDSGAWTGEISAPMLRDCGAHFVEIGHSERRTYFGETDNTVGRKTLNAIHHGLTPLICIGETREERNAGRALEVLSRQVNGALQFIKDTNEKIIFAYEPVWSIGESGSPASPEYADQMHAKIKAIASECLGAKIAVLYGGSVNSGNCEELIRKEHIDGLFIGRAAWNVESYIDILKCCSRIFD